MKLKELCVLGIDGSGFSVSVGLMKSGIATGLITINDGSPGSEILLTTIDHLLKLLQLDKQNLDAVCVTLGPGSFTSLRISLSIAESLGLGLDIPVYGVDSLRLIAGTLPFYPGRIKVIQNAYKGEFYTATYSTAAGKTEALEELKLIRPDMFYKKLEPGELILGTGVQELIRKGFDPAEKKVRWNLDFHRNISGISVIEYFLDDELRKPSLKPLEPIYIRLSDAEINYQKQFGSSK